MRIYHLSCGTMCPLGGGLWDGFSPPLGAATIVCHCLLFETEVGLVLVETGFGLGDVTQPRRLSRYFRLASRIRLREADTALRQIEALGFAAAAVRHIVLTHLDFDHAAGIEDFPEANSGRNGAVVAARVKGRGYRAARGASSSAVTAAAIARPATANDRVAGERQPPLVAHPSASRQAVASCNASSRRPAKATRAPRRARAIPPRPMPLDAPVMAALAPFKSRICKLSQPFSESNARASS